MKRALRAGWGSGVNIPLQSIGWEGFTGINLVDDNTRLEEHDAAFALNVDFSSRTGAISKSKGTDFVIQGLGAGAVYGLHIGTINNRQIMLAACGQTLWAARGGRQQFVVDSTADWQTGTGTATISNGNISGNHTEWVSPSYYLGSRVFDVNLEFISTSTVTCQYSISYDNVTWQTWHNHLSSNAIEFVDSFFRVRFLLGAGGVVERFALNSRAEFGNPQSILTNLTGSKIRFVDYNNQIYFCDGRRPWVYNGTTVRLLGVDPPITAPTLSDGGAGGLTGAFRGVVTFVNSENIESNPSPSSNVLTISGKQIAWSNIPIGDTGTIARRIYRTRANGLVYFLVATINNNTATTFTENVDDGFLTIAMEDNNNIPPNSYIIWTYNDVMFFASTESPHQLWFSKPGRPDHVPNITGNRFFKQFISPITMVRAPVAGTMVVCGIDYTAVIAGSIFHSSPTVDNTTLSYVGNIGAISHEAATTVYEERYPVSVAIMTEMLELSLVSPIARGDVFISRPLSAMVKPIFSTIEQRENVTMVYSAQKIFVMVHWADTRYANVNTVFNNVVLIYDLRLRKWQGVRALRTASVFASMHAIYFGAVANGQVTLMLRPDDEFVWGTRWGLFWAVVPYSDSGVPVRMLFDTGYKAPRGLAKARFRFLRIVVSSESVTTATQVRVVVDNVEQVINIGAMSTWNAPIGATLGYGLGRQDAVFSPRFPLNVPPGKFVGIRIEDNSINPLVVYGIILEYEPKILM